MGIETFAQFVLWLRSIDNASQLPEDDASCRRLMADFRFSSGFTCPCGSSMGKRNARQEWRCPCGRRTSVTAGTRMHGKKLPLAIWLRGFWEIGTSPSGISALRFQRLYNLPSYGPVLEMLRTIRECFAELPPLRGHIDAEAPSSTASIQILGRHRKHREDLQAWVALDLTAQHLEHAVAPTAPAALAAALDDGAPNPHAATAHVMCESFRTFINGTHHGVSVRHLWTYAGEFFGRWSGACAAVDAFARLLSARPEPPDEPRWENAIPVLPLLL